MPNKKPTYSLYTDEYFEKGHWRLKMKETLITAVSWLGIIGPILVTTLTIFEPQVLHISQVWSRKQGVFQLKLLGLILLFAFALVAIFTISMTIVQNHKRQRLVEQWPTYNPINQIKRQDYLENYMTQRFGTKEQRTNTRYYRVKPEQNIETDEFQRILAKHHVSDL